MKVSGVWRYRTPLTAVAVAAAGALVSLGHSSASLGYWIWMAGLLVTSFPLLWATFRGALAGKFAADLVASFAVVAAIILGQPLVGLVIVLMQSGGEALERLAQGRATDALRALQEAAPDIVHKLVANAVADVPLESIVIGDAILVRPGEMIPCDGTVTKGDSHLDTASLTGEPVPRTVTVGSSVMSGSVNMEGPLVIEAVHVAAESQ